MNQPLKRLKLENDDLYTSSFSIDSPESSQEEQLSSKERRFLYQIESPETINELPSEVFQLIIGKFLKGSNWRKLIPLRTVCKHWRYNIDSYLASRHGFQYSGQFVRGSPPQQINYHELNAMLSFYPNMRQLIVKHFTVSDHLIAIIRRNCPKLERLSLFGCKNLSVKALNYLANRFTNLSYIDLSHCDLDECRFEIICEGCKNLKVLTALNPGRQVTGEALAKLGPRINDVWIGLSHLKDPNSALEALVSGNGKQIQHFGVVVESFQSVNWNLITDNLLNLRSLKMTFGSYGKGSLTEFSKLKQLEFIVLAEDSRDEEHTVLTDNNVIPIIKSCNKLRSIAIAGTKKLTCRVGDATMKLIPKHCPNVEQVRFLNAFFITDVSLENYFTKLKMIRVLHLSAVEHITTRGVIKFLEGTKETIRNFRVNDCPKVTDEVMEALIKIAKFRPFEKIKAYLDGMTINQKYHDDKPYNLIVDTRVNREERFSSMNSMSSTTQQQEPNQDEPQPSGSQQAVR